MKKRIIEVIKKETDILNDERIKSIASEIETDVIATCKHLREANPYPIYIFPEPSESDIKDIGKFLHEHGRNSERIFAWWGRKVWNNCLDDLMDSLDLEK